MEKLFNELKKELIDHSNQENATKMKAYMKNHFDFLGIKSPERKKIARPYISELSKNYGEEFETITQKFWNQKQREFQYIGMVFLLRTKKHWKKNSLTFFKKCITQKAWWDTVDFLASNIIGNYMLKFYPDDFSKMEKWNQDKDMWIIRTSILFQLKYKEKTDWELLQKNILNHDHSPEFFLRKAMGWALREYGKRNPEKVLTFIQQNPQLSGLTQREALKHIG